VRITELGLEVELEVRAQVYILGSQSDDQALSFLDKLSGEKWVENGVILLHLQRQSLEERLA
jgi:hypothetical protein